MGRALLLLLLFEQASSTTYPPKKYYYVSTAKTWHDAQAYCKANHLDLAMFQNKSDMQLLSKPLVFTSTYAWIGLSDDVSAWRPNMGNASNSWIWSVTGKPSRTGYQNFQTPGEPNNYAAAELCVTLTTGAVWRDVRCQETYSFFCFTDTGSGLNYTFIKNGQSWASAVAYCRLHHTDLVMIEDAETNQLIYSSSLSFPVWIGLSRQAWVWADGSLVTYNYWQAGKPTNNGAQYCVTEVEETHQWYPAGCANNNAFICEGVYTVMNTVRVNLQSSANLADPSLHTQILQKLVEELRAQGYYVSKLTWSTEPQLQE